MEYLYNHTNEETAYLVEDYPWGYRLRTQVRYWVESRAKHGQRFCKQTLNPKTGKWCKPKKSTYSEIVLLGLNDEGHVKQCALNMWAKDEIINKMLEKHGDNLTDFQKEQAKIMLHYNKKYENVTFTYELRNSGPIFSAASNGDIVKVIA